MPPQRVLPAEEAAAALGGRDPRTLRCMFEHETAALWNGAAPNDIVEISLPSDGAGVRLDYRRCVAAPPKSD